MLMQALTFLSENRAVIIGATVTIGEVAVALINLYRKYKKNKETTETMSAHQIKFITGKNLLWAINPINLFRKP